jgi:hypothetical protein
MKSFVVVKFTFTHWYFCYKATPMTDDWAHTGVKLYYKGFFVMVVLEY